MKKNDLYKKEYLSIFCPDWTEHLWCIIAIIRDNDKNISKAEAKRITLKYIEIMLKNDLIRVGNEWDNKKLIYWDLTNEKTIKKIDKIWFEDAVYPDFLEMVWFDFKEWYIEALKNNGYRKERVLWDDFVEKNIGDLKEWIEDNKP